MAYCCARRKALGGLLLAGITVGTGVVGWKRFAAAPVELPEADTKGGEGCSCPWFSPLFL